MGSLLLISLEVAVPIRIEEIRGWTAEQRMEHGRGLATVIASHGDDLQYGGKHCVDAFVALANALACLAYAPGGVTFSGLTFRAAA
jgi:hypothetical protein